MTLSPKVFALVAAAFAVCCGKAAVPSQPQGDSVGNARPTPIYDPVPYLGVYAGNPVSVLLADQGGLAQLTYQGQTVDLQQIGWMACAGCIGDFGDGADALTSRVDVLLTRYGTDRLVTVERLTLPLPADGDAVGNASAVPPQLAGRWGGQGIGLDFDVSPPHYDLDCAHGWLQGPVTLNGKGAFSATGVYIQEHGGPSRPGEPVVSHPALYRGTVDGAGGMQLTLQFTDTAADPLTFTLQQGSQGVVEKCL